jgi:hypothetical protein
VPRRYATKYTGGYYVQAVIDQEAMETRKFRLCNYGVLRKFVTTQSGIHRNHLGERSDSVRATVLSVSRVQVGNVTQNEPFVAVKVAAAPLEYLEYLPKASSNMSDLIDMFSKCEQLRLSLGEDALKGSQFEALSDLADVSDEESSPTPSPPGSAPAPALQPDSEEAPTPEQLRAMVQRRVADAATDGGLFTGNKLGSPSGESLQGFLNFGALSAPSSDSKQSPAEDETTVAAVEEESRRELQIVADRICGEVAADGRRTRPGMDGGIGATTPFLLPSVYTERGGDY